MEIRGSDLSPELQREALARFPHRYTRDNIPEYARNLLRPNGQPYPVQFASDADWLANTWFEVTKQGQFSDRNRFCRSSPTWPDGIK